MSWHIALISVAIVAAAATVNARPATSLNTESALITGDLEIWDRIFASRTPQLLLDGPANDLVWTEGPIIVGNELIFSDTVGAKIYALNLDSIDEINKEDDNNKGPSQHLRIIKERSGDASPSDDYWRAEPGSNGLTLLPPPSPKNNRDESEFESSKVLVCQHGAQRLAVMDLNTGNTEPIATKYQRKRLNGPNDVVLRAEALEDADDRQDMPFRYYAYFTDPVYAWLEKDRFEDLPYLDDKVKKEGPGYCGVYRVEIDIDTGQYKGNVELVTSDMERPNGIAFDGDDLIVSDCCQGSHLDGCTSGISRWELLRRRVGGVSLDGNNASWVHSATIEDVVPAEQSTGGCADGFALYSFDDDSSTYGRRRRRNTHVLLASCFGGLCIVDLESGEVVARIWTANEDFGKCKISNVAIGSNRIFLTCNCGILTLPLRDLEGQVASPLDQDQESLRTEL